MGRYDGEAFRTFTAGEDSEGGGTFLLPDREGNLWFGRKGEKGVSRYDGGKVTRFTSVQNLLSYTRRSGGEFAPVDLNGVVDSTLALLQSHLGQAGVAVRVEKGEVSAVEGNFNELCTVLTNLLMNARDALVAEGRQGIIEITTAAVGGEVVLKVRDNGPGIPVELRERIFDPFYTTKPVGSGTGLGLSIVQGIVQRHQGWIEVESEEGGGGVTFAVYLPTLEKRRQTEGGSR